MRYIMSYISGYIQKRILSVEKCSECLNGLENSIRLNCPFVEFIDKGGLTKPAVFIDFIVKKADSTLCSLEKQVNLYTQKNVNERLTSTVVNLICNRYPTLMSEFDHCEGDYSFFDNHKVRMIKKICGIYYSVKLKHMSSEKKSGLFAKRVRRSMTKTILFMNQ